ncbi:hypothetical protein QJQ45_015248, partial [Haematococcus lacustris]
CCQCSACRAALGGVSPAGCELAVEPSSATDLSDDNYDDDCWSLASSSDDDEYCPGQASSQTECPDLIQADALTGSPGHCPLARLLEGAGRNMAAWQASELSRMTQQGVESDLESITVAELMYHGPVATGKGRLLLVTSNVLLLLSCCTALCCACSQAVAALTQQVAHTMAAQQCQTHSVGADLPPWSWSPITRDPAPWSNIAEFGPALWHRVEAALMDEISSTIDNEAVEQLMWLECEEALVEALADKNGTHALLPSPSPLLWSVLCLAVRHCLSFAAAQDPGFLEWGSWLKHEPLTGYVVGAMPQPLAAAVPLLAKTCAWQAGSLASHAAPATTSMVVSSAPLQAAAKQATLDAASRDARFVEGSPGYDPLLRWCNATANAGCVSGAPTLAFSWLKLVLCWPACPAEELMPRFASAHAAYPREASRG